MCLGAGWAKDGWNISLDNGLIERSLPATFHAPEGESHTDSKYTVMAMLKARLLNECLPARVIGFSFGVERWIKDKYSCLNVHSNIMRSAPVFNSQSWQCSCQCFPLLHLLYDFSYHLRNRNPLLPNEQHFELSPDPHMIKICAVEKKHKVFCCFVLSGPLKAIQGQNPVACVHIEDDTERTWYFRQRAQKKSI